jgi:hypothetical protein
MSKTISFGSSGSKADFKETVYEARIARIISTGVRPLHPNYTKNPDGTAKTPKEQLRFEFEVPSVILEGDQNLPALIALPFVNITGGGKIQSKLESIVEAAGVKVGAAFTDLLGAVVSLTVKKKVSKAGKEFFEVAAVGAVSDSVKKTVPPLVAKSYFFDFDAPDLDILTKLPTFIKDDFKIALNFSGSPLEEMLTSLEEAEGSDDSENEDGGSL